MRQPSSHERFCYYSSFPDLIIMTTANYPPPVDQLLTLGEPQELATNHWINYPVKFGFTLDHVPDLLRLVASRNEEIPYDEAEIDPAIYAPIHAWRAIGQLRAESAIDSLIALLPLSSDMRDEWVSEELPEVFGLIGPTVIPPLMACLADPNQETWPKITAGSAFVSLARHHPDQRSAAVEALTTALAAFADNGAELNSFLICDLLDLNAVEAASTIEQAFAADAVDFAFAGDWDEVQVALGLKTREEVPKRNWLSFEEPSREPRPFGLLGGSGKTGSNTKSRAKNKMAKQSRKKNRKKK
jgi:Protein of unknown function (DUF1186)